MMPHSSILDGDEKLILKDAILMYISNLQKRFYRDGLISKETYEEKMSEVSLIVDKLKLTDLYR